MARLAKEKATDAERRLATTAPAGSVIDRAAGQVRLVKGQPPSRTSATVEFHKTIRR